MTVCTVTGTLRNAQGIALVSSKVVFERSGVFGQSGAVVMPTRVEAVSDEQGEIEVNLYPGTYSASAIGLSGPTKFAVGVPEELTADLADIIDQIPAITPSLVTQAVAARDAAEGFSDAAGGSVALAAAEAASAAVSAEEAAASAGFRDFADVTTLLANTSLAYGTGAAQVEAGDIVRTRAEGFAYEVAASAATDQHVTTAGGVKLYRVFLPAVYFNSVLLPTAVTGSAGASGNLTGTYYYRVTYVTDEGETQPGSGSAPIAASSQRVNLTIPVSTDRRVVARNIYRTIGGAGDPVLVRFVATVDDNTTTAFEDNLADASLGDNVRWIERTGGLLFDSGVNTGDEIVAGIGGFSTIFGRNAMPAGGYASTAVGSNAMSANVSGYRNTAIGHDALRNNTSGANNTAVGVHAGNDVTTGSSNTTIGYSAAFKNVSGSENVSIGLFAATEATTGDRNVAVGSGAMQLRTAGSDNIGIGYQAARAGTGTGNIGVGRGAGAGLSAGNFNTYLGYLAAGGGAGSFNVAVGSNAGAGLTSGGSNVCIGPRAGQWLSTQSNNLFIDNAARVDYNDSIIKALVFGVFGATPEAQQFRTNGLHYANVGVAYPARAITADYTVVVSDHTINVTGTASVALTLPNPTTTPGKIYHIRNKAAFTVVSAAANVQPIAGGASGTAILPATAGAWCQIQAIGSAWEIIARGT